MRGGEFLASYFQGHLWGRAQPVHLKDTQASRYSFSSPLQCLLDGRLHLLDVLRLHPEDLA